MNSVLLLGATGQIGVFLIPRLLSAGMAVTAVSRDERARRQPERRNLRWIHAGDLSVAYAPDQARALISCGPVGLAASVIAGGGKWDRAVVFSTSSVLTKEDSADSAERVLIGKIIKEERNLKASCASAGIALALLRPTLVYGCGMDRNISTLLRWIRRFGFMPLAAEARGLRQPVHADDLAAVAAALLALPEAACLDSPVAGGSTLSFLEMAEKLFGVYGNKPRLVRFPPRILYLIATAACMLPGTAHVRPEMIMRQGRDLVFDDSGLRELLELQPRPFHPVPEDFSVPERNICFQLTD
jgi:nucleoside-diphosphate-sugar epimerase